MSYFARTIRDHIQEKINRFRGDSSHGNKMVFMVPAMPEDAMLAVAKAIAGFCAIDTGITATIRIASELADGWGQASREEAVSHGWIDAARNLTFYRSQVNEDAEKLWIIVLCGADRVTDAASLNDFHTCDPRMVWEEDMKKSFTPWVRQKLMDSGLVDFSEENLRAIDRVLRPVFECGRGDMLQISDWLGRLDLASADNAADVPRIILGSLQDFGVPNLGRFPLNHRTKRLDPYITKSAEFFTYGLFLEESNRKKALKAIDDITNAVDEGEDPGLPLDDEDVCGPYGGRDAYLAGLRTYIADDDPQERAKLMACDFVVMWDKVLKFKTKNSPANDRSKAKSLSGNPMEVLLTALWHSLRELSSARKGEEEYGLVSIVIESTLFKHDMDEGEDTEDNADMAREMLKRLVGGMDSLLMQHLDLATLNGEKVEISSSLHGSDLKCKYGKNAEPCLEFKIVLKGDFDEITCRYSWRLPEHHMYRLSTDLLRQAEESLGKMDDLHKLPVFHLAYHEELMQASSEEEVSRVLLHAIRDSGDDAARLTNLLSGDWLGLTGDPLLPKLKLLSEKYHLFIMDAVSNGIFASLFSGATWTNLRKAYQACFETAVEQEEIPQYSMAGMLTRAFLVIRSRPASEGAVWFANPYETSGVATILHPALLEMLEAQVVYLAHCFNYAASAELGRVPDKNAFPLNVWQTYLDLAELQAPVSGLLCDEALNLDANVRGTGLFHRIGKPKQEGTPMSTRLLQSYSDRFDDENGASDAEMFREGSESKLLTRLMLDYFDLHPHARDGLSLAVFRNEDIQPVIAAVHAYLKTLAKEPTAQKKNKRYVLHSKRRRPYAISVTIFTESSDDTDVASWVQQWQERWEASDSETKYELYRLCRFAIAHRIVERGDQSSFQKLINQQFEADISVFYDFIGAGTGVNRFEKVEPFDVTGQSLKFPILEKVHCMIDSPADRYKRQRLISNRQFVLGSYHVNLLHCLKAGSKQQGSVVVGAGDYAPWRPLIDSLHRKSEWVICIDPNMDERLVREPKSETEKGREIIGFGSGVGSHGQDNFTVSTQQFSLADVATRLTASIQTVYAGDNGWSQQVYKDIATGILGVAQELSGLSLVRATGVADEYIRDFMAYALTRKLLVPGEELIGDSLISLDAYRHWFDLSENQRRPDLMWLRVGWSESGCLRIGMRLIECKVSVRRTPPLRPGPAGKFYLICGSAASG